MTLNQMGMLLSNHVARWVNCSETLRNFECFIRHNPHAECFIFVGSCHLLRLVVPLFVAAIAYTDHTYSDKVCVLWGSGRRGLTFWFLLHASNC